MNKKNAKDNIYEHIVHPFPPLYDEHSEILILGSLPSVKSREQMFFYGHSQIKKIFCNGNTSAKYYKKYQQNLLGTESITLPSTSPANAAFSLEKLINIWGFEMQ